MTKTESIDALLSPSLRVSRPVAACSRCRSAKIKCDGKLPACSACERSGKASSCSGANDEFARGKERSYVAALEAASERLQRKIDAVKATPASAIPSTGFPERPSSDSSTKPSLTTRRSSGGRRKEASVVDELVGDLGFLSINATSRDFHGFASTMSFARLLLSTSIGADLPQFGPSPLPPRYATTPLIQHYLDNIFVLMPFFSETDLMTSISNVYQESGKAAKPLDFWFVRMVLAISAGASSQNRGDANHEMAVRHVDAAMHYAEDVLHPGSITGVQALLLLVQYSMVDPEHFRSWYLIGMATRLMVDLGIHVEPASDSRISKHMLDMRRRVFYCVYTLDRTISISLDRAFSFTDDSTSDVQLPSVSTDVDRQGTPQLFLRSLKPSLFLFDIRRVQSAFYQATQCGARTEWSMATATDYTASILNDVQSWHFTVPASLSQRHILYFRLEALYSQILALSPSVRIPLVKINDFNKTMLVDFALQFVEQMQPVIQDTSWHAFLTYTDICRVRFVGRRYLDVIWAHFDHLLSVGIALTLPSQSQIGGISVPPSFILTSSPLENCARIITGLRKIAEILDYARQRWGITSLRERFEQESAVLLGKLKSKQQELSNTHKVSGMGNHMQQHTSPILHGESSIGHISPQHENYSFETPPMVDAMTMPVRVDSQRQRPQYFRDTSSGYAQQNGYSLPSGSLPRRGYEFLGGQGS